jgi:hypothetical protein
MTRSVRSTLAIAVAASVMGVGAAAQSSAPQPKSPGSPNASQVIATWKATPQDVAKKMIAKYGQPQEVTANRLVWHNNGPWKYSELVNEEVAHDFPMPHKDALRQVINYKIAADKADELSDLAADPAGQHGRCDAVAGDVADGDVADVFAREADLAVVASDLLDRPIAHVDVDPLGPHR